ncbi:TPA: ead/Ea22-like family protein [Citrobacter freundii]
MTALNKQALRSKARSASAGEWIKESGDGWEAICSSDDQANGHFIIAHFEGPDAKANREFSQAANPATVLALLDELESAEKRIAELEGMVFSVKLPVAPLQYETLKLCLEPSDGYGMQKGAEYMRDEIIKVLHAAGIGVNGE